MSGFLYCVQYEYQAQAFAAGKDKCSPDVYNILMTRQESVERQLKYDQNYVPGEIYLKLQTKRIKNVVEANNILFYILKDKRIGEGFVKCDFTKLEKIFNFIGKRFETETDANDVENFHILDIDPEVGDLTPEEECLANEMVEKFSVFIRED